MVTRRPPPSEPRFGAFLATGAVLGFLVGAVSAVSTPGTSGYSASAPFGYIAVLGGLLGALLGGVVAAIFTRRG